MRNVPFLLLVALVGVGCGRTDLEDLSGDGGTDAKPDVIVPVDGGCPAGRTACSNACVDTQTDVANCGSCGNKCAANALCQKGACQACPTGFLVCNGKCVDVTGDSKNCGSCGKTCPSGQVCAFANCATSCPIGRTKCGSD